MNWYNLNPILGKRPDVAIIVGQRANGKTFSVCKYMLEQYKKTKKRFAYIRRWADDIKGFRAEQLFQPLTKEIQSIFGFDYSIEYYRHKYYLVNDAGEKIDVVGYALSLSEASHTKSVAYNEKGHEVRYILFDEFIQMAGEPVLRDELSKYDNVINTLLRTGDAQIFLLGNTVSKFSPYFIRYGIDINKVKQGDIVTKEYPIDDDKGILRVCLEYCEYNPEVGKKTSKYTTSKMISTGQWEIPPTDDIPTVKNEIVKDKLLFTIKVPDSEDNTIVCCFLRTSRWVTLEQNPETMLYYNKTHVRQFLILRTQERISNYFHLSQEKALNYHTYNDIDLMLDDIKEQTDIDVEHELFMGRVFSDNMFTADYFYHAWVSYGKVGVRNML